jgi:hypothetical protein
MKKPIYGLMSALGLSFWFFLAFPFADHKESCLHVLSICESGLLNFAIHGPNNVTQHRPLAFACEWITYNIGHSIIGSQIFNYLMATASWLVLFLALKEKRTLSLLALIAGAALFPGYLFLFHISGIGYGPILLFIALAVMFYQLGWDGGKFFLLAMIGLAAALFHPFGSVVYLAFMVGLFFEDKSVFNIRRIALSVLVVILAGGSAWLLNHEAIQMNLHNNFAAMIASYKTTEINSILSLVSFGLVIIAALSLDSSPRSRMIFIGGVVLTSAFVKTAGMPIIIIWIAVCIIKMTLMRKYALAALIVATFFLPFIGNTGTPTHAIYVILASTAATAIGCSVAESRLGWVNNRLAWASAICMVLILVPLRTGMNVPIASRVVRPIMAEREKTFQIKSIIDWLLRSEYKDYYIAFNEAAGNPRENLESAINREKRAPTTEGYLDRYLDWLRGKKGARDKRLLVTFGDETIIGGHELFNVYGRYAGRASVYIISK